MDTFSNEEKISKEYLENDNANVIVNIVDASNLSRNLYLTTQLMKYKKPIILVVNMIDTAKNMGVEIDCYKLSKELGISVIPMAAKKKIDTNLIANEIEKVHKPPAIYEDNWYDESSTYKELEKIVNKCSIGENKKSQSISDRIDSIALNKFLAYPIFIGLLYTLFKFTFDWVGGPLQEFTGGFIENNIATPASNMLVNSSEWFKSLIVDGIINSLGGALSFFPLIFVLSFGMSVFEDGGYMARIAFLMDSLMKKVGLSGKSFIPMVMGIGCSFPAIMATRTLESEKDRKITALIAPLMTCGAKLPIYAMFVSIFFTQNEALVTTSLYILGIIVSILVALFINKTQKTQEDYPFVMELPRYSLPTIGQLFKNTWQKSKGFLVRVTTIMFAMSVVIWVLSSFSFSGFTPEINESFLAYLGHIVSPIFEPLGLGDWRAGVSILTGLTAKEVVVSTMEILYGDVNTVLSTLFTSVTAYGFLVFTSLYTPCIAALATMQKEYGGKMTLISFGYQFFIAWVGGFYVYQIGTLFTVGFNLSNIVTLAIGTIIIGAILIIIYRKMSSTNLNKYEASNMKYAYEK